MIKPIFSPSSTKFVGIIVLSSLFLASCGSGSGNSNSNSNSSSSLSSAPVSSSSVASSVSSESSSEVSSESSSDASSESSSQSSDSSESSSSTESSTSSEPVSSSSSSVSSSSASSVDAEPEPSSFLPYPNAGADSLLIPFNNDEEVSRFDATASPGISPQISRSNAKLKINPEWNTTGDKLSLETNFPVKYMNGGSVSFNLYFTEDYIDDGNVFVQIYLKDTSGRYANTTASVSASGKEKRQWITHAEAINPANLDFVTDRFSINDITVIGIEIVANGKPIEVDGDIYIDNFLVNFAEAVPVVLSAGHDLVYPTEAYPFSRFDANYGHTNLNLAPSATGLTITGWSTTATANSANGSFTVVDDYSAAVVSFTNALMEMIVALTQAQVDDGIQLQIFGQTTSDYQGSFSGNQSNLRAGDNLISFQLTNTIADMNRIGLDIVLADYTGTTGTPVVIKAIGVTLDPSVQPTPSSTIDFNMTSGWRGNSGGAVTYVGAGVDVSMAGDGQGGVYDLNGPLTLNGATLELVVRVSQAFKNSGAALQPFAQEKATWTGQFGWVNNADLLTDSDMTINYPLTIDAPAEGIQIGIQANGAPAGTVLVKSARILLP